MVQGILSHKTKLDVRCECNHFHIGFTILANSLNGMQAVAHLCFQSGYRLIAPPLLHFVEPINFKLFEVRISDSKIGAQENYTFRNKKIVDRVDRRAIASWFPSICQFRVTIFFYSLNSSYVPRFELPFAFLACILLLCQHNKILPFAWCWTL